MFKTEKSAIVAALINGHHIEPCTFVQVKNQTAPNDQITHRDLIHKLKDL